MVDGVRCAPMPRGEGTSRRLSGSFLCEWRVLRYAQAGRLFFPCIFWTSQKGSHLCPEVGVRRRQEQLEEAQVLPSLTRTKLPMVNPESHCKNPSMG